MKPHWIEDPEDEDEDDIPKDPTSDGCSMLVNVVIILAFFGMAALWVFIAWHAVGR